ncbi:MAG: hypothetical protein D6744_02060 [Planctomycetota bacterium]|nr:MAG: hypothetical protein D6744_02060 [Planctomycetota bacterium]
MIDPRDVPDVEPEEMLARFILSRRHIRRGDDTIKPDAFVPHPRDELSVTRHRDATDDEVWDAGWAVAEVQRRTLYGRGDVGVAAFLEQGLSVDAAPVIGDARLPDNPNHANVTNWPDEKAQQKRLALEVAAQARLVRPPDR